MATSIAIETLNKNPSLFKDYDGKSFTMYVTIGFPDSPIPIVNKVPVLVYLPDFETATSNAKKVRKDICDNLETHGVKVFGKVSPAKLYWAIFSEKFARTHLIGSDNFPGVYHQEYNPNGILVNVGYDENI